MKWLLGIDFRHHSDGALRFATWMHQQTQGRDLNSNMDCYVGAHIITERHSKLLSQFEPKQAILNRLEFETNRMIQQADAAQVISQLEVRMGTQVVESLQTIAAEINADGFIVGRRRGNHAKQLVRLGSVTRRLLRALPSPVIVVSPDYTAPKASAGCIVVALTPDPSCEEACQFASRLAQQWKLPLVYVHVMGLPLEYIQIYWAEEELEKFRSDQSSAARHQLAAWLSDRNYQDYTLKICHGNEVEEVVNAADELDAALIVCGSRLLSTVERFAIPSKSSQLAAHANCPVAVVPPVQLVSEKNAAWVGTTA